MVLECPNCQFDNPDNTRFCGNCATPLSLSGEDIEAATKTMEVPTPVLKTGIVLSDRYEIIEELGKGGMGKVFKVLDREINEKIALKLIRPEIGANKKIIKRFQNELKMARKITHRNVCRMFDIGKDGDKRYITMEYVSGEDLKRSIRRMGPLTIRKTIAISKQICEGLSEAHRMGIVHRDLKPHNIMIDREGNTKIMDFGIALSQEAKDITDANIMIGTPQYLSPEQVEGKKADRRSDIYSLGVIMFEIATGQVPFDGETTISIAVKHTTEFPHDPREFNAQIPEDLSQLILKCLEKDPDSRYQSVEELCSELTLIEQDLPTRETAISKIHKRKADTKPSFKLSRTPIVLLLVALVVFGGYFVYDRFLKKDEYQIPLTSKSPLKESIAVLPFEDLSPDKEENPLYLLITDTFIVNLHSFQELRVINTRTVQAYKDTKKDIRTIGQELSVDSVLMGNLLRTEEDLRIMVQLGSVESGSVIWGKIFKRPLADLEDLQNEITKSVASALGIRDVEERYSMSPKALPGELLDVYFRGRHYELSYYNSYSATEFENCLENYLRVAEANPNDALPYWRLGNLYEARYNFPPDRHSKYLDRMFEYFKKAYDIDPNIAEANLGMGWSYFYKEDEDKAYTHMKRALEIDPHNPEINHNVGMYLRSIGLYEQALNRVSKALALDPMPLEFMLWNYALAECHSILGRHMEAAVLVSGALEVEPASDLYMLYARQLIKMNEYDEAGIQVSKAKEIDPRHPYIPLHQAMLFAIRGEKAKALELISAEKNKFRYSITSVYLYLGMKDEAIKNIQLGIDKGFEVGGAYFYTYPFLINDPLYDTLHNDARFLEIIKKEKKKHEERVRKYGDL